MTVFLALATQSAPAEELTAPAHVSFAGVSRFFDSLFASAATLPVQGHGTGAGSGSTRAGVGKGHRPGHGQGELGLDQAGGDKPAAGRSASAHHGFDPHTSVLWDAKTSAHETWWKNSDGTLTEKLSQGVVNYQGSDGSWHAIDPSLMLGPDGRWRQRANSFSLSLAGGSAATTGSATAPRRGTARPASYDVASPSPSPSPTDSATSSASPSASPSPTGSAAPSASPSASVGSSSLGQLATVTLGSGESFSWSLSGAANVPSTQSGNTVSYSGILPDTTLQLASENTGVKESLVLSSAQAGNSWTFPLSLTGLTVSQGTSGTWNLVDSSGNTVAVVGAPDAYDSNVNTKTGDPATTGSVSYSLSTVGGVQELTLTLDSTWLNDPSRVFPVTVDPTVSISIAGQDVSTYVNSNYPDQNYLHYGSEYQWLRMGLDPTGAGDNRSLLMFPASQMAGTGYHISSADLDLYQNVAQQNGSPYNTFHVYAPAKSWTPSTVTWNNQPSSYYSLVDGSDLGPWDGSVISGSCNGVGQLDDVYLDPGDMSQIAVAPAGNYFGLELIAGSESDSNYWKKFYSDQVSGCSPYIYMTYSADVAPQLDSSAPDSSEPVASLTPQLSASGHDPDNYPNPSVQYLFSLYDGPTGKLIVSSGSAPQASGAWSVPAGKLKWGHTYSWTVCVWDGFECQSSTLPSFTFTTTAPPPVLTGNLSQATDGHGFNAALGNYTTSATDATITTVGPALSVNRSYNSLDPGLTQAFGAGWSSELDMRARQVQDVTDNTTVTEVVVTYPDGSQVPYAQNSDGTFAAPESRYATFKALKNSSGQLTGYTLTDKSDTTYNFSQVLTAPATGTPGVFGITSITDRLGRAVNFAWGTVYVFSRGLVPVITAASSATSGRSLNFGWSAIGGATAPHVTQVTLGGSATGTGYTAATLPVWTYNYGGGLAASSDDLTSVCAPSESDPTQASSACTQYSYQNGSVYQSAVLDGAPYAYWPLSEAPGATSLVSGVTTSSGGKLCVDDNGQITTDGNKIQIWGCNNTVAQQWTIGSDGTVRALGKCLDVSNSGTANGTLIDLYTCNGTGAQQWTLGANGSLVNPQSGRCLDDPGFSSTAGTQLDIWDCNGGANQHWYRTSTATSAVTANAGMDNATYTNATLGTSGHLASSSATVPTFDGSSSVALPAGLLVSRTYLSVALWFKTSQTGQILFSEQNQPLGSSTAPSQATPSLYVGTDGKLYGAFYAGQVKAAVSNSTVNTNTWHFVVLSAAGNSQKMYLDGSTSGVTQSGVTGTINNYQQSYDYLGAGYSSPWPNTPPAGWDYFNGQLSDASFYTHALTATDAAGLYRVGMTANDKLTQVLRPRLQSDNPGEKPQATVSYDGVTGRVTSVTDANGATWGLTQPTASGSAKVYRSTVLSQQPQYYWTYGDSAGASQPVNEVNPDSWMYSTTTAQYNNVGLGSAPTAFNDGTTAATFDGSTSYATVPGLVFNSSPASLSLWFKTTGSSEPLVSANSSPISAGTVTSGYVPVLYIGSDGLLKGELYPGGLMSSTAAVNNGAWHHVVLATGSSDQTLYLDGKSVATRSGGANMAGLGNIYVGAGFLGGDWPDEAHYSTTSSTGYATYFNGSISDVAFYQTDLNSEQVSQQWQAYHNTAGFVAPVEKVTVTDPVNTLDNTSHIETYYFDPAHQSRLVKYTDALGGTTTYGYDTSGFLATVTDPNGDQTITGHDVRGNVVSTTKCQYQVMNACNTAYATYYPDDTTPLLSNTDPRNDQVLTQSDGRSGSASDTTYRTSIGYDSKTGDVLTVTDPLGRVTTTAYTDGTTANTCNGSSYTPPKGLQKTVTTPGGAVSTNTYYATGDVCSTTDADGLVTTYTYDTLGRVLSKTTSSPESCQNQTNTTSYVYDGRGRATTVTDPCTTDQVTGTQHQLVVTTSYDDDGDIKNQTSSDADTGAGGDTARTVSYTYNNYDQKASSQDPDPTHQPTTYTYDLFGNIEAKTDPLKARTTEFLYDADNRLRTTYLENTDAGGNPAGTNLKLDDRSYDAGGRIASDTDALGYVTSYVYYDNNLTYQEIRSDGTHTYLVSQSQYDGAGNLTDRLTANGLVEAQYTVDAAGRTVSELDNPGGIDRTTEYTYNADNYLTEKISGGPSGTLTDVQDGYDPLGHKTSETVVGGSGTNPDNAAAIWNLTDGGGKQAQDSVSADPAIAYGGATLGSKLTLDGATGYLQTNPNVNAVLNTTASYSISAWILPSSLSTAMTAVSMDGTTQPAFMLQYDPGPKSWRFAAATSDASGASFPGIDGPANDAAVGVWSHLVGVYDANAKTLTLYVNGAKVGSTSYTSAWSAIGSIEIGRTLTNGSETQYFNGQMTNVRAYQRALTQTEITNLFNNGNTAGKGLTTNWTLDARGLPTAVTNPNGNTTNTTYDEYGRLVVTTSPTIPTTTIAPSTGTVSTTPASGSNAVAATTRVGYDTFGDQTSSQDPNGNRSYATYNANGLKATTTLPTYTAPGASTANNGTTTYTYDADNELLTSVDPDQVTATHSYNNFGLANQLQVTGPSSMPGTWTTQYTYDALGHLLSTTDPNSSVTAQTYDYLSRPLTASVVERYPSGGTGPATYTTSYQYTDTSPTTATATSQDGAKQTETLDALGEVASITDTANQVETFGYDAVGDRIQDNRPDGTYTQVAYDMASRPVTTTNYDKTGTQLSQAQAAYNPDGTLATSTDALQHTTTYSYDATGQILSETQPVTANQSITVAFGYDLDGHQTAYASGNATGNATANGDLTDTNHTTYTTYNPWGLPESTIQPQASATSYTALSDRTTTRSYEPDGRLQTLTQPGQTSTTNVTTSYSYDAMGDLTQSSATGAEATTPTRNFTYDSDGRVLTAATSNTSTTATSNATSETFTYNDRGELLTAANTGSANGAGSSSFAYNGDGLMTSRQDASGTTSYTYGDTTDRLTQLTEPLTNTALSFSYTPNSLNYKITYGSGDSRSLVYDGLERLTSDTLTTSGGTTVKALTYGYDNNGNLTSKTDAAGTQNTYTYDWANRLTSWTNKTTNTTTNYGYDADSNRTQVGTATYTYDNRDQLTSDGKNLYVYTARGTMQSNGSAALADDAYGQQAAAGNNTYTYDATGRLITQGNTTTGTSTTLQYSGAGNTISADGTGTTYSRDPSGSLLAAGTSPGTGSLLWTDLHTDVVADFTAGATTVADTKTYDPLGNPLTASGTVASLSVGYQSEYTDPGNGQVNMAARWYNPANGQFTNKDAASNSPTPNTANANPFAYGNGNPLTSTDPSGHCPRDRCDGNDSPEPPGTHNPGGGCSDYCAGDGNPMPSQLYNYYYKRLGSGGALPSTPTAIIKALQACTTQQCVNQLLNHVNELLDGIKVKDANANVCNSWQTNRLGLPHCDNNTTGDGWDFLAGMVHGIAGLGDLGIKLLGDAAIPGLGEAANKYLEDHQSTLADKWTKWWKSQGGDTSYTSQYWAGDPTMNIILVLATAGDGSEGDLTDLEKLAKEADAAKISATTDTSSAAADSTASDGTDLVAAKRANAEARLNAEQKAADSATSAKTDNSAPPNEPAPADPNAGGNGKPSCAGCKCSFSPDTPVLLANSKTEPISALKIGDKVEAADPTTGKEAGGRTVEHVWINHDTDLLNVTVAAGVGAVAVIRTTANHPFWDDTTHKWVRADHLKPNDRLASTGGKHPYVLKIASTAGAANRWNLTVQQLHTYYVVAGGVPILVHNTNAYCQIGQDGNRDWSFTADQKAGPAPKYARRNQFSNMSPSDRLDALNANPTCVYCGIARSTQADHIYPVAKYHYDGGWDLDKADRSAEINQRGNLVGACGPCNGSKNGKVLGAGPGQWWPPGWAPGQWWPFGGGPQ